MAQLQAFSLLSLAAQQAHQEPTSSTPPTPIRRGGKICTICGYQASGTTALEAHIRVHTGEKPFACELCCYRTKQQSTLTRHMRTVHAPKTQENNIGLGNNGSTTPVQAIFDESQLLMLAANQAASSMLPL